MRQGRVRCRACISLYLLLVIGVLPGHSFADCQYISKQTGSTTTCVDGPGGYCQTQPIYETEIICDGDIDGGGIGDGFTGGDIPEGDVKPPWPINSHDLDNDGQMDCWKDITENSRLISGYPTRNNGASHSGIDVASDDPLNHYGHGSIVRSLSAGVVAEVGPAATRNNVKHTHVHVSTYTAPKSGITVDPRDKRNQCP